MTDFGKRYVNQENVLTNQITAFNYKTIIQGTWVQTYTPAQIFSFVFKNNPAAINDEIEYEIFAETGIKTFELVCMVHTTAGILTIFIDDISQGTIDTYSATPTYSSFLTLSVTILHTGMHSLRIKVTDKNASSTDYVCLLTSLRIK